MKTFPIFCFIFQCFLLEKICSAAPSCPDGSVQSLTDKTLCYFFHSEAKAFLNAEEVCVQQNGHLASIHSAFENAFISEHAAFGIQHFWIGANKLSTPGVWGWLDGTPFDYSDWAKGEPTKEEGFDCGAPTTEGGMWAGNQCYQAKPFVCLVKASTKPTKCPDGWHYYDGSCYGVFGNATFDAAEDFCFSNGAHLTSIHSSDENHFITNLIPFDPNDQVCDVKQCVWIGLFRLSNQSRWRWTDNSEYNFAAWAPPHPLDPYNGAVLWNGLPCNAAPETWASGNPHSNYWFYVCKKLAI